jgi:serine O-acetyltransferase
VERASASAPTARADLQRPYSCPPWPGPVYGSLRATSTAAEARTDMARTESRHRHGPRRRWQALLSAPQSEATAEFWESVRSRHPGFLEAVVADARIAARRLGDSRTFPSRRDALLHAVRLSFVTDAFLALVCYRAKAACQARRIPAVPRLFHRLAVLIGQVAIGDPVVIQPGVYLPHGQVVVDGIVEVGTEVALLPFVTIGLRAGVQGPMIGTGATIGTGAKVLGPVHVGAGARVGANAVVVSDVPDNTIVVGVPAKPMSTTRGDGAHA